MLAADAKFCCGGECGLTAAGSAVTSAAHWVKSGTGAVTSVTSGPTMLSPRCIRYQATATTGGRLDQTFASAIASGGTLVAAFDIWFVTRPGAAIQWAGNNGGHLRFNVATNQIRCVTASPGVAVNAGEWYRIDLRIVTAATQTTDCFVTPHATGVPTACTQFTLATSATTQGGFFIGDATTSDTHEFFIDNLVISQNAADWPLGMREGAKVVGLYPNGDGSHGGGWAAGVFQKGAGTNANNSDTDIWQSLANPLSTSIGTNFVRDITGTANTTYTEHTLADLPANADRVNAVVCASTTHSASATANNFTLRMADSSGGTNAVDVENADLSETTIFALNELLLTDTDASAWTVPKVNDTRLRFTSTDSNPDVYLDGAMLECAYTEVVPMIPHRYPYKQLLAH